MDKKMFRLSLVVLLFGLVISFSVAARTEAAAADKNKPKTLDTEAVRSKGACHLIKIRPRAGQAKR
jgi:hypothetical protein